MRLSTVSCAVLLSVIATCSLAGASQQNAAAKPGTKNVASKSTAKAAQEAKTLLIKFAPGIGEKTAKAFLSKQGLEITNVFNNLSAEKGALYVAAAPAPVAKSSKATTKIQKLAKELASTSTKSLAATQEAKLQSLAQALVNTAEINHAGVNYKFSAQVVDTKPVALETKSKAAELEVSNSPSGILPASVPNDEYYADLWGMQNMSMESAWDMTTGSQDVVVFVIDTGIDTDHPDLVNNLWSNPGEIAGNGIDDDGNGYIDDVHGIDTFSADSDPEDDHFHGTHVAGTIGAEGNNAIGVAGVNWKVKIGACKFLGADGSGSALGAIQCLDYILSLKKAGINVVATNNSWGGTGRSDGDILYDAFEANIAAGILPVMAAANETVNNDDSSGNAAYPCSYNFSGGTGDSLCVAAINRSNELTFYSNYGLTTVDLAAPGGDFGPDNKTAEDGILSSIPDFTGGLYGYAIGTSMAAPHITGLVALSAAYCGGQDLNTYRNAILNGVVPTPSVDGKTVTGGRANAPNTLALLCSSPPPCKADFEANPTSGPAPLPVNFTDLSKAASGIASWSWDFDGDGSEDSNEQNPAFTYDAPNSYTVALTVTTTTGETCTETKSNYIQAAPPEVEVVDADITGVIITKNTLTNKDAAQFKMKGMKDIGSVVANSSTPFDLIFTFDSYTLTVSSSSLDIGTDRMIYRDATGDVVRCVFNTEQCVVNLRDVELDNAQLDKLLTGEMTVSLQIGNTKYSNKGTWTQYDSGSGSWTKYIKNN